MAEEIGKTERAKSGSTERQNSVDEDAILSGRRRQGRVERRPQQPQNECSKEGKRVSGVCGGMCRVFAPRALAEEKAANKTEIGTKHVNNHAASDICHLEYLVACNKKNRIKG
jgi:hypothetical protein